MNSQHLSGSEIDFGAAARPPARDRVPSTDGAASHPGRYQVALTTHHERRVLMPMEAEIINGEQLGAKEHAMDQRQKKPVYHLFIGVDIAYRSFTAASLASGAKPKRALKPFEQTAGGFEQFQKRLQASGIDPGAILVVIEGRLIGARDLIIDSAPLLAWHRADPDAAFGHAPAQHPYPLLGGYRVHTLICCGSGLPLFFLPSPANAHGAPY
ncbi:MAG TPA: hypothetical protein VFN23_06215 [Ktedonobacteraceae bacterium]|nr:hypothetical protein [Ktedonobacteraceae bacterium]